MEPGSLKHNYVREDHLQKNIMVAQVRGNVVRLSHVGLEWGGSRFIQNSEYFEMLCVMYNITL